MSVARAQLFDLHPEVPVLPRQKLNFVFHTHQAQIRCFRTSSVLRPHSCKLLVKFRQISAQLGYQLLQRRYFRIAFFQIKLRSIVWRKSFEVAECCLMQIIPVYDVQFLILSLDNKVRLFVDWNPAHNLYDVIPHFNVAMLIESVG